MTRGDRAPTLLLQAEAPKRLSTEEMQFEPLHRVALGREGLYVSEHHRGNCVVEYTLRLFVQSHALRLIGYGIGLTIRHLNPSLVTSLKRLLASLRV